MLTLLRHCFLLRQYLLLLMLLLSFSVAYSRFAAETTVAVSAAGIDTEYGTNRMCLWQNAAAVS